MNKKKAIITLVIVTITVACGPDSPETVPDNTEVPSAEVVSATSNAIGAAIDLIVLLPENREPIHQGNRTFEVSGRVLVRADGITTDGLESMVRQHGWTFVDEGIDPRICDKTMPDSWGWPHCVLGGGDPNALYLDVRSVTGTDTDGFEVAVWAYRNVSVPYNRHIARGVGFSNDSEYDNLASRLSDHPGVLNGKGFVGNPGTFIVTVAPNGATSHEFRESSGHHGPFRHTAEEQAWHRKWSDCHERRANGDMDGFRKCEREHWEMGKAILEESAAKAEAAVVMARERGGK